MSESNIEAFSSLEAVVMQGDLSKLSSQERVIYYKKVCESLGLNPLTKPFDYLVLKGKTMLYARKDATEQLRKIHGISIEISSRELVEDVYVVTARAKDKNGRQDESIGAVTLSGLRGEDKANAMMKGETKAKRRVTLSICGLGMLDETEVLTIPGAKTDRVNLETGEILSSVKWASKNQIDTLKDLVEVSLYPKEEILKEFGKSGARSYREMTKEFAEKMISWLESKNEIDQDRSKVA